MVEVDNGLRVLMRKHFVVSMVGEPFFAAWSEARSDMIDKQILELVCPAGIDVSVQEHVKIQYAF